MLYQIYDLCLYPIKLKDKRGEHGAGSGCQVPVCPVINMFCGCGNSRNVQGTSGDILFSSKAGAQLSPALMSPLLAHGDCRACRRAEELGCLGAPGPCKIAPDRGYSHGRHCSMWTPSPPNPTMCAHAARCRPQPQPGALGAIMGICSLPPFQCILSPQPC